MIRAGAILVASVLMFTGLAAYANEEADLILIANVQKALEATGKERKEMTDYMRSLPVQSPATVAAALAQVMQRPARWTGPTDMRYPVLDMIYRSISFNLQNLALSDHRVEIANYLGALLAKGKESERFYFLLKIKTAGHLWTQQDVPLVLDLVAENRSRALGVELYRLVQQMSDDDKLKFRRILYRDPQVNTREDELSVLILTDMARPRDYVHVLREHVERYQNLQRELHRNFYPATGIVSPSDFLGAVTRDEMEFTMARAAQGFPRAQQIKLAEMTLDRINQQYLQGNPVAIEAINTAHEYALSQSLDGWNVSEFFRRIKTAGFSSVGRLANAERGRVVAVDFVQKRIKDCDENLDNPEN